jgi:hypothetical protein
VFSTLSPAIDCTLLCSISTIIPANTIKKCSTSFCSGIKGLNRSGTYNSHLLKKEEVRESLEKYCASLEDKVKGYRELIEFMRGLNCTVSHLAVARRPLFFAGGGDAVGGLVSGGAGDEGH